LSFFETLLVLVAWHWFGLGDFIVLMVEKSVWIIIKSNYVTHKIGQGTTLRKWAYSSVADANNPTVHTVGCPDAGNLLVPGTCLGCTLGNAKLQKDNVITYSLTMDNTKNQVCRFHFYSKFTRPILGN
jgi:hypothetical protein